jgi:hypothetical protein
MHDPYKLTPDELARALARVDVIRAWCDGIESAAIAALVAGQQIPGYRLGFNKPREKWADPEAVMVVLKDKKLDVDEFAPRELVTPPTLRKILKRLKLKVNALQQYVTRNDPKLVVTEVDNTYYDDVNAVDLAVHLARSQGGNAATAAPLPREKKARGAKR